MNKLTKMSFRHAKPVFFCLVCLPFSFGATGQTQSGFLANAAISAGYGDNIFKTTSEIDIADKYAIIAPTLSLTGLYSKHLVSATYAGSYTAFSELSDVNYAEHDVQFKALFDHSLSLNTELNAYYQKRVEDASANNVALDGRIETFEKYDTQGAAAKLYYGTRDGIGQIVMQLGIENIDYESLDQAFRDVDQKSLIGTFYYNLSPKLQLLLEGRFEQFDYDDTPLNIISQTNDSAKYYLGVEWQATAATTGAVRMGYLSKEFEAQEFEDFSGFSFVVDLSWEPTQLSTINIQGSRIPNESVQVNVAGFFTTRYTLGLVHEFSPILQFVGNFAVSKDDIVSSVNRTDTTQQLSLGLKYSIRRDIYAGLNYRYEERESDLSLLNYEANIIELTINSRFN